MDWIIVGLLALLFWRVAALRNETRRLFVSLAGAIDRLEERLSDAEHGIDQARIAANDARDAVTADPFAREHADRLQRAAEELEE